MLHFKFVKVNFSCLWFRMLEYSLDGHNVSFSAIRTVRVLRPLRAINRVPSEYCFPSLCFHLYIFPVSLLVSLFYNPAIDLKQMIWSWSEKRHACCIYRITHAQTRQDSHDVLTWSLTLIVAVKCPQSNII